MNFDTSVITGHLPQFIEGVGLTAEITVVAFLLGYAAAILLAMAAMLPGRAPGLLVSGYVTLFRSVPFIITLFIVYYGLPFAGLRLPAYAVGTVALGLNAAAYYTEVIRAALLAVPRGQMDAARAIGLSFPRAMHLVLAPQVFRTVVPPSTSVTLSMMKDSAVLSSITVPELTYQGLLVQGDTFAPVEVFVAVTLLYWGLALLIAGVARRLERRLSRTHARTQRFSPLAAKYLSLEWRDRPA